MKGREEREDRGGDGRGGREERSPTAKPPAGEPLPYLLDEGLLPSAVACRDLISSKPVQHGIAEDERKMSLGPS